MVDQEIRTFVAVELPETIKKELVRIQHDLRNPKQSFMKWVDPKGMHLTLKFLGNVKVNLTGPITEALQESCREQRPFSLEIKGLGVFPDHKRPRVLWIGITTGQDFLTGLQKSIDDKLSSLGFIREKRPFSPHITLARVGDRANAQEIADFVKTLQNFSYDKSHSVDIDCVYFIMSQLFPSGAVYTTLAGVKLVD
jgi:2'-5' RNA ligase